MALGAFGAHGLQTRVTDPRLIKVLAFGVVANNRTGKLRHYI